MQPGDTRPFATSTAALKTGTAHPIPIAVEPEALCTSNPHRIRIR